MRIWVNGVLVEEGQPAVAATDHGVLVGDGVFETLKVVDGVPFALTRHLRRLRQSALGLGLAAPDDVEVRKAVREVLASGEPGPFARLRITYTSGVGPLGSERQTRGGTLMVAAATSHQPDGPTAVVTVPFRRNEHGALTGLKTISYAENAVALAQAHAAGASEALFANTAGNLCEGSGTNVFVVHGGRLTTPPLSAGCLAGVTRALVLDWCDAVEADLPMAVLADADEVFLTSSLRDVQPVSRVDDRVLPEAPGPITRAVMETFARNSRADADPV